MLCLAGCGVVAPTQGCYLGCIWGRLVKLQGSEVVLKFDVFSRSFAVFLRFLHGSNDPLCG